MALGNIQWRFQEPVDFGRQLSENQARKSKMIEEMGKNLGSGLQGVHDYMLDKEAADMIEGTDTEAIKIQIKQIDERMREIQGEIENLNKQKSDMKQQITEQNIEDSFKKEFEFGGDYVG